MYISVIVQRMPTVTIEVKREVSQEVIDIVKSLSLGLRARDIGPKLGISSRTVEAKIDKMRADYGAITHAHLVGIFIRNKIIE